ncbi:GFA family protein [Microbulbifer hainanensis]|uniref:GFA family protein n=1 Tax=Microbulbifer hainanensis TaxID=2735675 RepID=UPI00186891C7|nr:GFA family protein [Microbulbifer hainanensis]
MKHPLLGGCACSKVRYECLEGPLVQLICHCRDCQQASGGAFSAFVIVPRDRLAYSAGSLRYHDVTAESGRLLRRQFCCECGSPVSAHWPDFNSVELLTVASLDEQSVFKPTHELWVSRAEAWHPFHPDTIKVQDGPGSEVVRDPLRAYFAARRNR